MARPDTLTSDPRAARAARDSLDRERARRTLLARLRPDLLPDLERAAAGLEADVRLADLVARRLEYQAILGDGWRAGFGADEWAALGAIRQRRWERVAPALHAAVVAWSRRWNINEPWVHRYALATLASWQGPWDRRRRWHLLLPNLESSDARDPVRVRGRRAWGADVHAWELPLLAAPAPLACDPSRERVSEYRARAVAAVEAQARALREPTREHGTDGPRNLDRDLVDLARYQTGETRAEIEPRAWCRAARRKAIGRAAEFVGLRLRPPDRSGRPRDRA